uniref:Xylulose kinase-1 n=1 Tax=Tanacetum cinerariifolium TaxID=118510 RepID=A0A6L2P0Q9_TANCI|nr:hypothetical protein [Tanacetum cinerariifolium]
MSTPKFAKTHNLVAFLEKPTKSEGFEQIIDFLNANPIMYALTVNPTIYTSCIKQFWATSKVKTINEEKQIQSLVDQKKVIIIETSVRSDLHLKDAEGTECLPTITIFEKLTLIGLSAMTTTWNEFSSTMASAIICLTINQKYNFSKYVFDHMVKSLEDKVKFLMFPRFVQVYLDSQVEGRLKHKEIYVTPSHTKKIFANMKRQGKDFSSKTVVRIEKLTELMKLCTKLQSRFLALETTKVDQALEIGSLKRRVKKLEKKASKKTHKHKRFYKIGSSTRVESYKDASLGYQEDASKQGRMIANFDANEGVALVNETQRRNDQDMFDTSIFDDEEVVAKKEVSTVDPVPTASEVVTTAGVKVSTAAITFQISMDDIKT